MFYLSHRLAICKQSHDGTGLDYHSSNMYLYSKKKGNREPYFYFALGHNSESVYGSYIVIIF